MQQFQNSMIFVILASTGCSGANFGDISKSQHEKKSRDSGVEQDSAARDETEDEGAPATHPIQVSGAFLTVDCAPSEQEAAGDLEHQRIGCAVVDTANWTKFSDANLTLDSIVVKFADGSEEPLALSAAPESVLWHAWADIPKGSWTDIAALLGRFTVSKSFAVWNQEPGKYQPELPLEVDGDNPIPPAEAAHFTHANRGIAPQPLDQGELVALKVDSTFAKSLTGYDFGQSIDGSHETKWLGKAPAADPSWIYYELKSPGPIKSLWLTVGQSAKTACSTKHDIWVSTERYIQDAPAPFEQETLLISFSTETFDGTLIQISSSVPSDPVRYIRIATSKGCPGIGWREIELFR